MVIFPPCKINLGLHIVAKKPDGYHDLETCFYPVPITDVLEMIVQPDAQEDSYHFSGLPIDGPIVSNLVYQSIAAIRQRFPRIPSLSIYLHKSIPMGGGLGGGSSDGANALKLLNDLFELDISPSMLREMAAELGSDCAFFIDGNPALASGRGEVLTPVEPFLKRYSIVLVNPNINVSTPWAFRQINPQKPDLSIESIIQMPVMEWKDKLKNDFQAVVAQEHPQIGEIIGSLYANGAAYAAMSGSGSTCFGLFKSPPEKPQTWFPQFWVRMAEL